MTDRTYYAIVPRGTSEPDGIFYKWETDSQLDLIGLNRLSGEWESMPNLFEFFFGDGSGDRLAILDEGEASKLAQKFGVALPPSERASKLAETKLAAQRLEDFACHSKACAPPPVGTGGSLDGPRLPTVKKKGSDKVFVPTVKKKGAADPPKAPTIKKKEAPAPTPPESKKAQPQPEAPAPRPPERPTVTPPAERASVLPVTRDLATKTPSEIDHELFPLWAERWTLIEAGIEDRLRFQKHERYLEDKESGKPLPWDSKFDVMTPSEIEAMERRATKRDAAYGVLTEKIAPYDDEFKRRGGWPRYVFVPDGHFHKERCSTCYPTTQRLYVPDASGSTHAEMVEKYDYAACTICFPDAPVEARAQYLRDQSNAKKAERDKLKAEKATKQAEKMLLEPVRIMGHSGTVKSVHDARTYLKMDVESRIWYGDRPPRDPEDAMRIARNNAEYENNIKVLSEALRAKGFDVDSMIAKWEKAARKIRA